MPAKQKGEKRSLRKLIGGRKNKDKGENGSIASSNVDSKSVDDVSSSSSSLLPNRSISNLSEVTSSEISNGGNSRGRGGIIQRLRERSRSRSRAKSNVSSRKEMLVAVTSCRSDGYYNQKAPGSTFKLPRKAPTNLKLFHELAVGVKDAYAAVGATPKNPKEEEAKTLDEATVEARSILWDFVGNLDFVSVVCRLRSMAHAIFHSFCVHTVIGVGG